MAISKTGTWRVMTATVAQLEDQLNTLAEEGYDIFEVLPLGDPEPQSKVPRDQLSLEQRATFVVVARRAPA
jgi:hypothetical protein